MINQRCRLDNRGGLTIGANVSISPEVHILTADHDLDSPDFQGCRRPVKIDDYVFIGSRAIMLPGVTVGRYAAIGAGAVVTCDVAPGTIVGRVPARVIGHRRDVGENTIVGQRHCILRPLRRVAISGEKYEPAISEFGCRMGPPVPGNVR